MRPMLRALLGLTVIVGVVVGAWWLGEFTRALGWVTYDKGKFAPHMERIFVGTVALLGFTGFGALLAALGFANWTESWLLWIESRFPKKKAPELSLLSKSAQKSDPNRAIQWQ